jgi:2-oxoglutarate ferredoxin oxidoreductase subunit beta
MNASHAFNALHGRMPSVATGAVLANRRLLAIGISGDGDTASIGIGQFVHLMRRNLPMVYVVENNGVYGLTKGQFSATADVGSTSKGGAPNALPPIDTCALAIQLGATFVGRSFSGDKRQLSALLKGAIAHRGTALLDVVSPCVTFNDHEGSTKSYAYMKDHDAPLQELSFVPAFEDIAVDYDPGTTTEVTMHDGSRLRLRKLDERYDPSDRVGAVTRLLEAQQAREVLTGLLYAKTDAPTLVDRLALVDKPLATLPERDLRPPPEALDRINDELR